MTTSVGVTLDTNIF